MPEGQGNTTNRSWAEVVASPARGEGGMVAQGTTGTREQVTHHITPLLCSSPLFCDNNVVFITKWTIVKLVHIPNFQKKNETPLKAPLDIP